jgi:hypothetical protein
MIQLYRYAEVQQDRHTDSAEQGYMGTGKADCRQTDSKTEVSLYLQVRGWPLEIAKPSSASTIT